MVSSRRYAQGEECSRSATGIAQPGAQLEADPGLLAPGQELALGDGGPLADAAPRHQEERLGVDGEVAVDLPLRRALDREVAVVEVGPRPPVAPEPDLEPGPLVAGLLLDDHGPAEGVEGREDEALQDEGGVALVDRPRHTEAMAMSRPCTVSSLSMWQVRTDSGISVPWITQLCELSPAAAAASMAARKPATLASMRSASSGSGRRPSPATMTWVRTPRPEMSSIRLPPPRLMAVMVSMPWETWAATWVTSHSPSAGASGLVADRSMAVSRGPARATARRAAAQSTVVVALTGCTIGRWWRAMPSASTSAVFRELTSDEGRSWLASLPTVVAALEDEWDVRTGSPYRGGTAAWTAPATTADGRDRGAEGGLAPPGGPLRGGRPAPLGRRRRRPGTAVRSFPVGDAARALLTPASACMSAACRCLVPWRPRAGVLRQLWSASGGTGRAVRATR